MKETSEPPEEETNDYPFSDEKLFTVDSVSNSRTNHFISHQPVQAVPEHVKYTLKIKLSASVMMFGLISSGLKLYQIKFY